jgi:hypothetical protein
MESGGNLEDAPPCCSSQLLAVLTFGVFTRKQFHSGKSFFVFASSWVIFVVVAGYRRKIFLCPRCGQWFFSAQFYYNDFARKCVNCKMPLYSKNDRSS